MLTTFLTRADVQRHLQALHLLKELREAFTSDGTESAELAFTSPGPGSVLRHGAHPAIPATSVLVRSVVPGKDSKTPSTSRVVLQLHDRASGKLLAVMDGAQVLALRTALMGALSVDLLARADATNVAILGSGPAASGALKALRLVRSITRVWLHEPEVAPSFELALRLQQTQSMAVTAAETAAEAVAEADIVVLTGGVALPDLALRPGTHVTVLAAPGAAPEALPAALLAQARLFCDVAATPEGWGRAPTPLARLLAAPEQGRASEAELTVFASLGPAFLDLVAGWHVLEGARADDELTRFDLEA